jgi:CheY-like chemotaxis protein
VTRTILVVDDEPDLVANCARLLRGVGHESLRAHTGPDAMALIDREGRIWWWPISGSPVWMAWPWRATPVARLHRSP